MGKLATFWNPMMLHCLVLNKLILQGMTLATPRCLATFGLSECNIHCSVVAPWLGPATVIMRPRAFGCFLVDFISNPLLDESLKKEKNKLVETASE